MNEISAEEFIQVINNNGSIQIVDVREPYEYNLCCIKRANKNIPMGDIIDNIHQLDQQKALYLVCKSGKRATAVANLLVTQYQFEQVFVLNGGIEAYMKITQPNYEIY